MSTATSTPCLPGRVHLLGQWTHMGPWEQHSQEPPALQDKSTLLQRQSAKGCLTLPNMQLQDWPWEVHVRMDTEVRPEEAKDLQSWPMVTTKQPVITQNQTRGNALSINSFCSPNTSASFLLYLGSFLKEPALLKPAVHQWKPCLFSHPCRCKRPESSKWKIQGGASRQTV